MNHDSINQFPILHRFEVARQTVETETGPQKRCLIL